MYHIFLNSVNVGSFIFCLPSFSDQKIETRHNFESNSSKPIVKYSILKLKYNKMWSNSLPRQILHAVSHSLETQSN